MKLKKCKSHSYTLQDICVECGKECSDAHYKYVRIRSVQKRDASVTMGAR